MPKNNMRFEHEACGVGFVANTNGRREHRIITLGLEGLRNLAHRGGIDADEKTGDGAGVLTQVAKGFFADEAEKLMGTRPPEDRIAVGFFFLPQHPDERRRVYEIAEAAFHRFGITLYCWRWVPHDASILSTKARDSMPRLKQALLGRAEGWSEEEFERRLYLARRVMDAELTAAGMGKVYMPSMSSRTIVYKGLFRAEQPPQFYLDLQDERFESAFCIFHVRFGTNTFPAWELAHPYRGIAHNGEMNTTQGNRNWMRAREQEWTSDIWGDDGKLFRPLLLDDESDSASFDRVLELLILSGRDPIHALMMIMPEPWENKCSLPRELRGFFEYHAGQQEPWDGPACVVFAAGNMVGAKLDRNGLRPCRYKVYRDGTVVLASEVGIIDLPESEVVKKGRLGPGQMIAIDLATGRFYDYAACRNHVASLQPYADWIEEHTHVLPQVDTAEALSVPVVEDTMALTREQISFGWSAETLRDVLAPMVITALQAVGSMGNDAAPAVLSRLPRTLADYLKQVFAQVTNPPIDALREAIVMSLWMWLGRRRSWLEESAEHAKLVKLASPFLMAEDLAALEALDDPGFRSERIRCLFPKSGGVEGYDHALTYICEQAEAAIHAGTTILILSDRGQDAHHVAIPMLQVVGTLHHYLISKGLRMQADIVVETGTAFNVHTFATLIGYGASAVHPYLACASIAHAARNGEYGDMTPATALLRYKKAIEVGLLKVIAKMGVSTLRSYHAAQLFSAVGLGRAFVNRSFRGTVSLLDGIGLEQVAADTLRRHSAAFSEEPIALGESGDFRDLPVHKGGETHAVDRPVVKSMYAFRRNPNRDTFAAFVRAVQEKPPFAPRMLWDLRNGHAIPIAEVEPAKEIVRHFLVADMSDGALSPLAHRTLAEAMNRLGAKSGSGEGGEDPSRFGTITNSAGKQWAPARFGGRPDYILSAVEMVTKMAQAAKAGEGGQLPGFKVTARVANTRGITPGVGAFSPAPHHDIYSIEDIMKVISDLKQLHPGVRVCVKLVSCPGVDIIAAGCAKAGADVVLIAGHEGGTGAAPQESITHAGDYWETGLALTHATLLDKGWREHVVLRVDGGLRTPFDVVVAGILGAEEFAFGTLPVLATGCVMKRECHLNTCPVGVATQDEKLWEKYTGRPEDVMALFTHLAEGVREILAVNGVGRLRDLIGRTDLLVRRSLDEFPPEVAAKASTLDTSRLTVPVGRVHREVHPADWRRPAPANPFDDAVAEAHAAVLAGNGRAVVEANITNRDRNIGTRLAGIVAKRFGNAGLPNRDALTLKLSGSAGQSFGMFAVPGIRLELEGDANDGAGKSLAGGEIIIRPPRDFGRDDWHNHVLIGNVALYGATGGRLFCAGQAGERFAVRNSGAEAVVEGVGDHACTFMTRGFVVSIGDALGWNFGSGSSGDCAMVLYDRFGNGRVPAQMSKDVSISRLAEADSATIARVKGLIEDHLRFTDSPRAREILNEWETSLGYFWLVRPVLQAKKPVEAKAA